MMMVVFSFTMMVMISCSAFMAVAQDVTGGDSQSPGTEAGASALPNAEVLDLGKLRVSDYRVWNGSLTEGNGDPLTLQIALDFMAKDTEEEE